MKLLVKFLGIIRDFSEKNQMGIPSLVLKRKTATILHSLMIHVLKRKRTSSAEEMSSTSLPGLSPYMNSDSAVRQF